MHFFILEGKFSPMQKFPGNQVLDFCIFSGMVKYTTIKAGLFTRLGKTTIIKLCIQNWLSNFRKWKFFLVKRIYNYCTINFVNFTILKPFACFWITQSFFAYTGSTMTSIDYVITPTFGNWFRITTSAVRIANKI